MRFKFAEHADEISAAWIWARMVRLSRSRTVALDGGAGLRRGRQQHRARGPGRGPRAAAATPCACSAPVEQILVEDGRATRRARGRARPCPPTWWSRPSPPPASGSSPPGFAAAAVRGGAASGSRPSASSACSCASTRARHALLLGQHQRPPGALRGHDRVHEPEPAAGAGRRPRPLRAPVPLGRRPALRARATRRCCAGTRTPSPSSTPPSTAAGSASPRCSATASPSPSASPTTGTTTPAVRHPGAEPVPHRLLPAPSPRPHHQRQLRPGTAGGRAGPAATRAGRDEAAATCEVAA